MNTLAIVFLAAQVLEAVVSFCAQLAEVRSLRSPVPDDFRDSYDERAYRRTQEYTRDGARVDVAASAFELVVLLGFWLLGGFGWWDQLVRTMGWGEVAAGLLYVGGLVLARAVLSLPFGLYSTFVVEKRFGFNRTSPATYAADLAKGLALTILLGAPLLGAVLWLLSHPGWWPFLVLWAVGVLLTVVMQYVVPIWVMPLFNRFTPLEDSEVRDQVVAYTERVGFPIGSLHVVDGSRRSTKANAFFTGFGRNKRLALYDTLLSRHAPDEIVAVVAHEVGHYRLRHVLQGMVAGFAEMGLGILALALLMGLPELFAAFGVSQPSVYAGLVLAVLFMSPFARPVSVPLLALSRHDEYQADAYAARTGGGPAPMVRALKRLAADSLSHLTPAPVYVWLHYSHPPMTERVRALLRLR